MSREIPYKIYLEENEMPKQWYNVRADMKKKPAPLLNPHHISTFRRRFRIFIKCIVRLRLFGHTVWKRNWIHRLRFIINLKETIQAEATSSTLPLPRHTMQRNRA